MLCTVVAVLVLVVAGVGIYGLVRGPNHPTTATHATGPGGSSGSPGGSGPAATAGPVPAVLPKTDDPVVYARAVAAALFDWNTTLGYAPADYSAPVVADGDPSGEEIPGLTTDVTSYLPTTDEWTQLTGMQVVQHLTITSAVVPSKWPEAVAQAHGQLRPGTTAITITGTRHRTGTWDGQPQEMSAPVSFTIFETCTPGFSRCHTLRLSELGDPLH